MSSSEFALKQLEKHGWKKGSGLGKEGHGMSAPIKVTLKMDKAGMGHDSSKEFTDHWWLRAFNDAAKKTGTKKQTEEVKNPEDKQKEEMSARKRKFYAGFVKSGTLQDGVEEKEEESESDEEPEHPLENLPTLDELHKLCGGANGSRAAAAGIKMSGKLARVAEQERLFEEKLKVKMEQQTQCNDLTKEKASEGVIGLDFESKELKKKKKKKRKKKNDEEQVAEESEEKDSEGIKESEMVSNGSKKKKRKSKNKDEDIIEKESEKKDSDSIQNLDSVSYELKKKKKKRKNKDEEIVDEHFEEVEYQKKKKKTENICEKVDDGMLCDKKETSLKRSLEDKDQDQDEGNKKKKKKSKNKDLNENFSSEDQQDQEVEKVKRKKKKRKK